MPWQGAAKIENNLERIGPELLIAIWQQLVDVCLTLPDFITIYICVTSMLRLCVTNLPLMSLASEFLFFFVAGVSMQRNLHEGFATDALELKSKAPSCDIRYAKHS